MIRYERSKPVIGGCMN